MIKYFFILLLIIPAVILHAPLLIIMYLKPNWFSLKFRYKYSRLLLVWMKIVLNIDYRVEGYENIPEHGPVVITPNHQSLFDSLSFVITSKRPVVFIAKKETKKMPYVGWICAVLDGFFLNREDIRQSLKLMKEVEEYLKTKKDPILIVFPEGTRTKDPDLAIGEFKAGTYKAAYKAKATIIPAAMNGTPRILKFKTYLKHRVDIRLGKPLIYDEYKDMTTVELAKHCEDYAKETLVELLKINDIREKK